MFGIDDTPPHTDVFTGEYSSWNSPNPNDPCGKCRGFILRNIFGLTDSTSNLQSTNNPTSQGTGFNFEQVAIIVLVCFLVGLVIVVAVQQLRLGKIAAQLQNRV